MAQRASSDDDVARDDDIDDESIDDDNVDDAEDSDEEDEEDEDEKPRQDPRVKRLKDEAARRRVQNRKLKNEVTSLREEVQRLKDEGVSDEEAKNIKAERDNLKAEREKLQSQVRVMLVDRAIRDGISEHNLNPKKVRAIIKQIDMDEIEVDEDGEVSGIAEALETIAEEFPEWKLSDKDDDTEEDEGKAPRRRSSGRPSGKRKTPDLDRQALLNRYPALR